VNNGAEVRGCELSLLTKDTERVRSHAPASARISSASFPSGPSYCSSAPATAVPSLSDIINCTGIYKRALSFMNASTCIDCVVAWGAAHIVHGQRALCRTHHTVVGADDTSLWVNLKRIGLGEWQ
jgi:hypothetical protein